MEFSSASLEDKDRHLGRTYPKGLWRICYSSQTVQVVITYSKRFRTELPLLVDVKAFEGIRIHPGNFSGIRKVHPRWFWYCAGSSIQLTLHSMHCSKD